MPSPVQPGEVIADRYRVERVIGMGGMGVVLAARHLALDHLVAIKLLLPDVVDNTEAVSRFLREARAAVRIQNEHVARVMDVGTLPTGAPYMVMEYLEGSDLSQFVRSKGPLPIEEAVDFLLQACEAVAEAHSLGIVHRDLKPGNLFLVERADGSRLVKVLDFGISKMTGIGGASGVMTSTAAMMGSPLYMSPEQLASARDVDVRTDIWSLGVILFELLTSKLPFAGDSIPQLCVAILHAEPRRLALLRPDVPPGLEAIVARCLEKDRILRYGNVADLSHALLEFAPDRSGVSVARVTHLLARSQMQAPVISTTPGQTSTTGPRLETVLVPEDFSNLTPAPAAGTNPAWGQTTPQAKPQRRRTIALALAGLALVAVAVGFLTLLRPAPPATVAGQVPSATEPVIPASAPPLEPARPLPAPAATPEERRSELPPPAASPGVPSAAPPARPTKRSPPPPRAPAPSARPPIRNPAMPGSGLD
jgi:serine/threonine-protein kinase